MENTMINQSVLMKKNVYIVIDPSTYKENSRPLLFENLIKRRKNFFTKVCVIIQPVGSIKITVQI